MWLILLTAIILIFLTSLIIYARWNYGTLEALGIPVVKTSFILGSTPDLHKKVVHFEDIQRFKKYGKIYGVYEGRTPQIHICDPVLIRLIYSQDFEHFHDRRDINLGDSILNEMLDFVPGEKWKTVRSALTPTLSSARIKSMVATTKDVVKEFNEGFHTTLAERNEKKIRIDVRNQIAGLVLDFLARCSFGIKIGNAHDPDNYFVKTFKNLSGNDKDFDFLYNLSLTFPFLTKFSPTLENSASSKFADTFRVVMKERMRNESRPKVNDLADKLIEMLELLDTPEYRRLGITENTILAQAVGGFFLAAYDSIITSLVLLLHHLATNPSIQKKIQEEIDVFFESKKSDEDVTSESLSELPYLGACITETLRLAPPFIRPERICTKDWTHETLRIKKGTVVMLPSWAYHRNPELYTNPEEFIPERHLGHEKKNQDNYAFSTFGFGPRNCPGNRFANESMKMCMAYILKEFQFSIREDTKIEYKPGVLFLVMYDPIYLDIVTRA